MTEEATRAGTWGALCGALNRQLEFRGYGMLRAQVDELVQDGALQRAGSRIVAT